MINRIRAGAFVLSALLLGACTANDAGIFRAVSLDGTQSKSLVLDAKQRGVFAVSQVSGGEAVTRFCSEPSPDALSAIASSFAISTNVGLTGQGSGAGALGASLTEAAQQLGKRNATTQLLRDAYYRLCEASLNGKIERSDYVLMTNKLTTSMMMLLAIEEITANSGEQVSVSTAQGGTVNVNTSIGVAAPAGEDPKEGDAGTDTESTEPASGTTDSAGATAGGGQASVGSIIGSGGSAQVPVNVTNTIDALTERFVKLSLAQDCMVWLDKASIDIFDIIRDGHTAGLSESEIAGRVALYRDNNQVLSFCKGVEGFATTGTHVGTAGGMTVTELSAPK